MTREQERQILRQNMNHYLWNKPRANWTEEDLKNLKAISVGQVATTKVVSNRPRTTRTKYKQPVTVIKDGNEKQYESVVLCAAELEIEPNAIYAKINGRLKNNGQFQFFKSKINN